ncbi:MAG: glycosyltransferase family 9 protein, partial [Candidatus Omnitrophota bacterium]|nr:glycosyltransferase family 9 protein [Candidatus Omnitrophota bacterium]
EYTIVVTTDETVLGTGKNGLPMIAETNVVDAVNYHPAYFAQSDSKRLEINYHEFVSHIARNEPNERRAAADTKRFVRRLRSLPAFSARAFRALRRTATRNAEEIVRSHATSIIVDQQTGERVYFTAGQPFVRLDADVYIKEGMAWNIPAGVRLPASLRRLLNTRQGGLVLIAGPFYEQIEIERPAGQRQVLFPSGIGITPEMYELIRRTSTVNKEIALRALSDEEVYARFGLKRIVIGGRPATMPVLGIAGRSILLPVGYTVWTDKDNAIINAAEKIKRSAVAEHHFFGLEFKGAGTPAYQRHNIASDIPATVHEQAVGKPGVYLDWWHQFRSQVPVGLEPLFNGIIAPNREGRVVRAGGLPTRLSIAVLPIFDQYGVTIRIPIGDYRLLNLFFDREGRPVQEIFNAAVAEMYPQQGERQAARAYFNSLRRNYLSNLTANLNAGLLQGEHGSITNMDLLGYEADMGDFNEISSEPREVMAWAVRSWVANFRHILELSGNDRALADRQFARFVAELKKAGRSLSDERAMSVVRDVLRRAGQERPDGHVAMIPALEKLLRRAQRNPGLIKFGLTIENQGRIEQVLFWTINLALMAVWGPVWATVATWSAFLLMHAGSSKSRFAAAFQVALMNAVPMALFAGAASLNVAGVGLALTFWFATRFHDHMVRRHIVKLRSYAAKSKVGQAGAMRARHVLGIIVANLAERIAGQKSSYVNFFRELRIFAPQNILVVTGLALGKDDIALGDVKVVYRPVLKMLLAMFPQARITLVSHHVDFWNINHPRLTVIAKQEFVEMYDTNAEVLAGRLADFKSQHKIDLAVNLSSQYYPVWHAAMMAVFEDHVSVSTTRGAMIRKDGMVRYFPLLTWKKHLYTTPGLNAVKAINILRQVVPEEALLSQDDFFALRPEDRAWFKGISRNGPKQTLLLNLFASRLYRDWRDVKAVAEFVEAMVSQHGLRVIFPAPMSRDQENIIYRIRNLVSAESQPEVRVAAQSGLHHLKVLIYLSDYIVTVDTGVTHFADALGKRPVVLFNYRWSRPATILMNWLPSEYTKAHKDYVTSWIPSGYAVNAIHEKVVRKMGQSGKANYGQETTPRQKGQAEADYGPRTTVFKAKAAMKDGRLVLGIPEVDLSGGKFAEELQRDYDRLVVQGRAPPQRVLNGTVEAGTSLTYSDRGGSVPPADREYTIVVTTDETVLGTGKNGLP